MSGRTTLRNHLKLSVSLLALPLGAAAFSAPASAQLANDEVIVTATRRAESVQDIAVNIAAIGSAQIEQQGFDDVAELASFVPGINISDQGGRDGNRIVVRGLNAEPVQNAFGQENGGGTVATYIGEIPLYVDLRLNDLQRVEVLLGPQGTLYGAGTLGGAIRYIPNKPKFDGELFEMRADAYGYSEGSGVSTDVGFTFNVPVTDNFAIRGSLDNIADKGFINNPYVVRAAGVSNPDPIDFNAPGDNFRPIKDANTEDIFSGRMAARWAPTDALDATLTYYFQNGEYGGRNTSSLRTDSIDLGEYEFGTRVEEPSERDSSLLALEVIADLGFAELTSATGVGRVEEEGQRDQTDLLISLDFGYEFFPSFTAFTFEDERTETFNQELRLVSKGDSRLNWIVGAFYNENEYDALSSEFTPGYAEDFGVPLPGSGALEYFEADRTRLEEKAIFGEIGYQFTDKWDVTFGLRVYEYDYETANSTDFPLADYLFFDEDTIGLGPTDFSAYPLSDIRNELTLAPNQSKDGELFKINTSYKFDNGNLAYATFSQGFRVGASNGGDECTDTSYLNLDQNLCLFSTGQRFNPDDASDIVILDERGFEPDTTNNFEVGMKTTWLDGALRLNGAIYHVEWDEPQVNTVSINAGTSITVNAKTATSTGFELDGNWRVNDRFNLRGNASFTDAQLTADVPGLIQSIATPGFAPLIEAGRDGDRLPGSPEQQFSVFGDYAYPLQNGDNLMFNAGYAWQSDVLTFTGGRAGSFTLPSYGRANVSATYDAENWSLTGYVDNLFDDFSETSASNTPLFNQTVEGANVRRFRTNVLPPRSIGARVKYRFE